MIYKEDSQEEEELEDDAEEENMEEEEDLKDQSTDEDYLPVKSIQKSRKVRITGATVEYTIVPAGALVQI